MDRLTILVAAIALAAPLHVSPSSADDRTGDPSVTSGTDPDPATLTSGTDPDPSTIVGADNGAIQPITTPAPRTINVQPIVPPPPLSAPPSARPLTVPPPLTPPPTQTTTPPPPLNPPATQAVKPAPPMVMPSNRRAPSIQSAPPAATAPPPARGGG